MYRKYTEHGLINVKFSCCLWLKKCFIIHLHSLTAVEFQRNCLSLSYFLAFFPLWLWFQATVCPLACLYVHVFALYVSGLFDTYLRVSRSFLMVWSHDCTYQIIAQSPCACICVRFVWIWLCVCVSWVFVCRGGGCSLEICLGSSVVLLRPEQSAVSLPSYRPQHNLFPQKFVSTDISLTTLVVVCAILCAFMIYWCSNCVRVLVSRRRLDDIT